MRAVDPSFSTPGPDAGPLTPAAVRRGGHHGATRTGGSRAGEVGPPARSTPDAGLFVGQARGVDVLDPAAVEPDRDQPLRRPGHDHTGAAAWQPMPAWADRLDGDHPVADVELRRLVEGGRRRHGPSRTTAPGAAARTR